MSKTDEASYATVRAFNINDYARVKFSAASLRLWREDAERMRQAAPTMAHLFPDTPPLDAAGFYRGQFWSIMQLVAPQLVAGGSAFEGCLVHLEFEE